MGILRLESIFSFIFYLFHKYRVLHIYVDALFHSLMLSSGNLSNSKTTFICYYAELSFEIYKSSQGQLASKWGVIEVWSPKQKSMEKVQFTSHMGNDLYFPTSFWAYIYQSTPKLAFQQKIKQQQVQNWQKIKL